ncbi:gastrin-releasing peptide receptor-like [Branchiostoma floridae]|uniref:Gastrin-releasing peptide receptor n=1 Tax=Branchiostoma floridae TaxID=7739 RepID=A0A9J7LMX6_BRAFL|nr:gastrin-releasing peptide receptor-like [Branchiostoma floridae]
MGDADACEMDSEAPPEWTKVVVAAILTVIALTGLLGNGTVIRTVCANKNMRNIPNVFITSLAIGDFLVMLTCVPFTVAMYFLPEYEFGSVMCKLTPFMQLTSIGVSIFTLTAMSHDRYQAIVNTMNIRRSHALSRTVVAAVGIWLVSMSLGIADVIHSDVVTFTSPNSTNQSWITIKSCMPNPFELTPVYPRAQTIGQFAVLYCVPLMTIAAFYILIARHLLITSRNIPGRNSSVARQMETRKNVAKTVLILVLIFALCWLPVHVFNLWRWFALYPCYPPPDVHFYVMAVSQILMYANSCVNPFALCLSSKSFQTYFRRYLCFWCSESEKVNFTVTTAGPVRKLYSVPDNCRQIPGSMEPFQISPSPSHPTQVTRNTQYSNSRLHTMADDEVCQSSRYNIALE